MYELKIPKKRVGSLIGIKGRMKKMIERHTSTRLKIDTEGDVEIHGEGYHEYICGKIVMAVGRGFNPYIALSLLKDDCGIEIIDLNDAVGNKKHKLLRVKSRLIGRRGKSRKVIERLTGCHLSVYGKTVAIIGELDRIHIVFRGIEKLIHGSTHGNAYGYLEREMKKVKKQQLL